MDYYLSLRPHHCVYYSCVSYSYPVGVFNSLHLFNINIRAGTGFICSVFRASSTCLFIPFGSLRAVFAAFRLIFSVYKGESSEGFPELVFIQEFIVGMDGL